MATNIVCDAGDFVSVNACCTEEPPLTGYRGPLVSRDEAKLQKLTRYFDGAPCVRGHISQRLTGTGRCIECKADIRRLKPTSHRPAPDEIPTRYADAVASGSTIYAPGTPCKNGHIAYRWTKTSLCSECKNKLNRRWAAENPVAVSAIATRYCGKNIEKRKARDRANWIRGGAAIQRAYRARTPEQQRAYIHKRLSRLRAGGTFTAEELQDILRLQKWKCGFCKVKLKGRGYHLDHRVPLSKGGKNVARNLQALCARCNLSKNDRDEADFAREMGLLI